MVEVTKCGAVMIDVIRTKNEENPATLKMKDKTGPH
jgi:hypothetical protein